MILYAADLEYTERNKHTQLPTAVNNINSSSNNNNNNNNYYYYYYYYYNEFCSPKLQAAEK